MLATNAAAEFFDGLVDDQKTRAKKAYSAWIATATKADARLLLKRGPCARQAGLFNLIAMRIGARVPDGTIDDRLRRSHRAELKRIRSGHYLADANRFIALRGHLLTRRFERRFAA